MSESVNHPAHYNAGKYEVIDIIEGNNWGEGFNRGNAVKYVLRAGIKNPDKEIEDLEKARWYIDREIQRLRAINTEYLNQKEIDKVLSDEERIWENGDEIK